MRTHCPDGVQLKVFPIYIALVNENGGFKNTSVNRPFSNHRKTLLSGWVGGDILGPLIFLKIVYNNKQDVLLPNMASQVVYGHLQWFCFWLYIFPNFLSDFCYTWPFLEKFVIHSFCYTSKCSD